MAVKQMNRLKKIRQEKGVTQKDVSDGTGIPANTYSNYERGDREPKLDTWKKLADYFDVDVGYLQGITDVKHAFSDDSTWEKRVSGEISGADFVKAMDARGKQMQSDQLSDVLSALSRSDFDEQLSDLELRAGLEAVIANLIDIYHFSYIDAYDGANFEWFNEINKILHGKAVEINSQFDKS